MPEVVRAEVIEVRAIKHLGLVGVTGVLIAMIHANQNYLLESEVIGYLQRRIGHCPAFMHSHADVVTEAAGRLEEHTSELQSLMRISYAVFCLTKKNTTITTISLKINTTT